VSWSPETVSLSPEDTGGEIIITLGTGPVEPGRYRLFMVLASTPGGFLSGIEARAPFEVGDAATVDQIRLQSVDINDAHPLDHPGDTLVVWCRLSRSVRPDETVTLSIQPLDFEEGVSVPDTLTVPPQQLSAAFALSRTADAMTPGTYSIAVGLQQTPDTRMTVQFAVEL